MAQGPIKKPPMNYVDTDKIYFTDISSWTALGGWKYCYKTIQSIFGRNDIKSIQVISWGGGRFIVPVIDESNISFQMLWGDSVESGMYVKLRGFY